MKDHFIAPLSLLLVMHKKATFTASRTHNNKQEMQEYCINLQVIVIHEERFS